MPFVNTNTTSINYGQTLRIGYRMNGASGPFTYLPYFPNYNELPYQFSVPSVGVWEIEYSTICPNCSGNVYSEPDTTLVTAT